MTSFMILPPSVANSVGNALTQGKRIGKAVGLYNVHPIETPSGGLAAGREWLAVLCNHITPKLSANGKFHIVLVASGGEVMSSEESESPEDACVRILLDNGRHLRDYADEITLIHVLNPGTHLSIQYIRGLKPNEDQLWREFHGHI